MGSRRSGPAYAGVKPSPFEQLALAGTAVASQILLRHVELLVNQLS